MVKNEGNLTGGQIQEVMDTLLYKALEPIIYYTKVFDSQLVYLLTATIKNKKRRLCALDRDQTANILTQAIIEQDPETKLNLIKSLKIERSFIHVFVKRFLEKYRNVFVELYYEYMSLPSKRSMVRARMLPYVKIVGAEGIQDLFLALTQSGEWLSRFYKYFDSIVGQYHKFCYTQAKSHIDTNTSNTYDPKDVVQNFLRNVVVAVNKYDSSKGALTSYIKYWILNSLTCASSEHEYGLAYTIPQGRKKSLVGGNVQHNINFSTSMDALLGSGGSEGEEATLHELLTAETEDINDEHATSSELDKLYLMAKRADPFGIARLTLEIPEVFTREEYELMDKLTLAKL